MSVLKRIAYFRERGDEIPNQELAKELAKKNDVEGIEEIVDNLWNENRYIQSDCLKVLYEIGYINPGLIADYVGDFLKLLKSDNNRMVWGAMIALSTISELKSKEIGENIGDVIDATDGGSVITVVNGVKTLAKIASCDRKHRKKIFPVLLRHLRDCIPRDVPTHAENTLCAVDESNKKEFLRALESRRGEMNPSQLSQLRQVLKKLESYEKRGR